MQPMPFFLLLLITISTPCFGQALNELPGEVWEVGDRRWTVEEERRFEKWVDENVTEDFLFVTRSLTIVRMLSMRSDGSMPGFAIFPPPLRQKTAN